MIAFWCDDSFEGILPYFSGEDMLPSSLLIVFGMEPKAETCPTLADMRSDSV